MVIKTVDAACVEVSTSVLASFVVVIRTVEASSVVVCCGKVLVKINVLAPWVVVIKTVDAA